MQEKIFPGTLDSLAPVRAYVVEAARAAGLDSRRIYNLCLAVDEIATNIVLHGYEEVGLKGDIIIEALQERGRLLHEEIDTQINSATNRSMRALTVISTLLIPPTLVTGGLRHERAGRSLRALAERLRRGDRALWHGGRRALLPLRRLGM